MTMRAALPMYDHPAQRVANDRLWDGIAARLTAMGVGDVPPVLTRSPTPERLWQDPALLFGQTCGYPLVTQALPLRVLALPIYTAPGCTDGWHRSLIVVRADDPARGLSGLRARRAAINDRASNTGMNLFRAAIAPLAADGRFFDAVVVTGGHRASIDAILHDRADCAAIDAVTYAGTARFEPEAVERLKIVAETPASPTLPFVTAAATPEPIVAALRTALAATLADPALADVRAVLALTGIAPVRPDTFDLLPAMAEAAARLGYPELA